MKKKLIISDIAKQLNISITTVSFILNGKAEEKRISKPVIEKVTKLIDELGYKPNQLAKSLRTGKTNIIGLVVEDISNQFFAKVAKLIEENANKKGYRIIYCSTDNQPEKAKELIAMFSEQHVDGYIITPPADIEEEVNALINNNLPVVLFDRYFPQLPTDYVVIDNFGGAYNATKHLIAQGYGNIAFVTIASEQTQMQDRCEGYKKVLSEYNKQPKILKTKYLENPAEVIEQIYSFMQKDRTIDALLFGTNYLGLYGLEALKQLNIKIPTEIGVISFDDHDLFRLYIPSITAIAQPIHEISTHLINILLANLELKDASKPKNITQLQLPADLIIRESSQRDKFADYN